MSNKKILQTSSVLGALLLVGLAFMGYGYNTVGLPLTLFGGAGLTLLLFYIQWLR